jgi:hypothetical protein
MTEVRAAAQRVDAEMSAVQEAAAPPVEEATTEIAAEPALSSIDEARGLVGMLVAMVVPFMPRLAEIYDEPARESLAQAAAPLLNKYGVSVGSMFERWKEEVAFAFVALPLALKTVQVLKEEQNKKRQVKKGEPAAPETVSDAAPVIDRTLP